MSIQKALGASTIKEGGKKGGKDRDTEKEREREREMEYIHL
jgi:hypothetical protein